MMDSIVTELSQLLLLESRRRIATRTCRSVSFNLMVSLHVHPGNYGIGYRLTLCANGAQDFVFKPRTTQLRVVWRTVCSAVLIL